MNTFDHKGTAIELLPNGKFQALIGGVKIVGTSLSSVKTKIDNNAKAQFTPFLGLSEKRYGNGELVTVEVIGVKAPRKGAASYKDHHEFVLANGDTQERILENSADNLAAHKAYRDYMQETHRIDQERRVERERLREELKYLNADNYAPKKPA